MRACPVRRYDSFASLRVDMSSLFSPLKSAESVRRDVRMYVRHQHRRGALGLLLDEARRRGSYTVARAAVEVALERETNNLMMSDSLWVKNAIAACRTAEEVREMERLLSEHHLLFGNSHGGAGNHHVIPAAEAEDTLMPSSLHGGEEEGEEGGDVCRDGSGALVPAGYSKTALATLRRRRDSVATAPNASFSRYFIRQGVVADERELMELFKSMRGRQPVAFRVHTSQMYGKAVESLLHNRPGITPLSWMPSVCGAFLMMDTPDIPHNVLLANRQLLSTLSNEKVISFQSTSSMLPVLLLDPRPGESVLDMCASPGSKTTLILDYMSGLLSSSSSASKITPGIGCIVANDTTSLRRRTLTQRLQNISPSIAVTQIQGQTFPAQPVPAGGARYDKVLVDAPCSGEGRIHRDVMSWRMWHPQKGMEFFPTQVALLRQAVELCAVGGCVVYSTCTLNPLENEAVISTLLAGGEVELIRPPPSMITNSGWNFSCGLRRWHVPSRAGGFLQTFAEAEAKGEKVIPEIFPHAGGNNEAIASAIESCCLRVLPHRNGGAEGFFLAALRKVHHNFMPLSSSSSVMKNHRKPETTETVGNSQLLMESVLHSSGILRLSAGNMLLKRHLGGFFNDSMTQVEGFLTKNGFCAAWQENRGLLLISENTWTHIRAIPSSTSTSATTTNNNNNNKNNNTFAASPLLELGVVVIEAASGSLTEAGAFYLRPHATSRVLQIPFSEMQWLLSHQMLKISELQEDPTVLARQIVGDMKPVNNNNNKPRSPLQWVAQLFDVIHTCEGNFIVTCLPPSSNADTADGNNTNRLASISLPVVVRKSSQGGVELHLSLSQDARQRCLLIIGRVISHQKRSGGDGRGKHEMQMSAQYNTSKTMNSAGLEGRPLNSHRQHRHLYTSISPASSSTTISNSGSSGGGPRGSSNVGERDIHESRGGYFEI